jgi:glucose-6-phosphate isomerase
VTDAPELWTRYRQYFCRVDSLVLTLDISRIHYDESFLASMEPVVQRAFCDMDALESGGIANPKARVDAIGCRLFGAWDVKIEISE